MSDMTFRQRVHLRLRRRRRARECRRKHEFCPHAEKHQARRPAPRG